MFYNSIYVSHVPIPARKWKREKGKFPPFWRLLCLLIFWCLILILWFYQALVTCLRDISWPFLSWGSDWWMTGFLFFLYASLRWIPYEAVNDLVASLPGKICTVHVNHLRWSREISGAWAMYSVKDSPKPHCEDGCNQGGMICLWQTLPGDTICSRSRWESLT